MDVVKIPTNQPISRMDKNDLIFQSEHGKFKAIAKRIKELHQKGQPVLIGTVSIEKNELLSEYIKGEGVPHEILNAKNHEREGEIIAQAGRKGAVTIATNMAGRGVDIKLGGNPTTPEEYEKVKSFGGLFVLGTERHEARRIDNQLRGRSGRQGDPGETRFYVSLEDSLMRIFASDLIKRMMGRFNIPEEEPIENRLITRSLETAQTKIEGVNFDARKNILEFDDVLNHQRAAIYKKRRKILTGSSKDIEEEVEEVIAGDEKVRAEFDLKRKARGDSEYFEMMRRVILGVSDMLWVEHLEMMDYLRGSVNLRAYGQRDPLVEYKKEGLRLFKDLGESTREQIIHVVSTIGASIPKQEERKLNEVRNDADLAASRGGSSINGISSKPAVGRNDPCPCGSGKKFKKCHGQ